MVDASGAPVAGAEIRLVPVTTDAAPDSLMDEPGQVRAVLVDDSQPRAVSDEAGRFAVADAGDGPCWLIARAEGHAAHAQRITLRGGQALGGPVQVTLAREQIVEGRVVDAHGAGVPDVRLAFTEGAPAFTFSMGVNGYSVVTGAMPLARPLDGWARTGSEGRFRLPIPARCGGVGYLLYLRPGFDVIYGTWWRRDGNVPWPDPAGAGLRLVARARHAPLGGARFGMSATGTGGSPDTWVWGRTDAGGRAPVPCVAATLQALAGRRPDGRAFAWHFNATVFAPPVPMAAPGEDPPAQAREVPPPRFPPIWTNTADEVVEVPIDDAATLRATGSVRDEAGRPVAGAQVIWTLGESTTGMPLQRVLGKGTSDEQGRYAFPLGGGNPSGGVHVAARAPGFAPADVEGKPGRWGREPAPVDVVLRHGAWLLGRVLDDAGRPLAGARVTLGEHDVVERTGNTRLPVADAPESMSAATDARGRYVLRGVPLGREVHVVARYSTVPGSGTIAYTTDDRPRQAVPDLVLARGRDVLVHVLGPDGLLRAGATVDFDEPAALQQRRVIYVPAASGPLPRVSDAAGDVRFAGRPLGAWLLTARAQGTAGAALPLQVEAGTAPLEVTIRLRRAAPVAVHVLDHRGRPVPDCTLSLVHLSGAEPIPPRAWYEERSEGPDGKGRFRFDDAPAGVHLELQVHQDLYKPVTVAVAGDGAPVEVRLEPWDADLLSKIEDAQGRMEALGQPKDGDAAAGPEDPRRKTLQTELDDLRRRYRQASGGASMGGGASCGGGGGGKACG